jgi:hypothetical protein
MPQIVNPPTASDPGTLSERSRSTSRFLKVELMASGYAQATVSVTCDPEDPDITTTYSSVGLYQGNIRERHPAVIRVDGYRSTTVICDGAAHVYAFSILPREGGPR